MEFPARRALGWDRVSFDLHDSRALLLFSLQIGTLQEKEKGTYPGLLDARARATGTTVLPG